MCQLSLNKAGGKRLILGGKIFENVVLHSFLFHFKYDFIFSIPTYRVIIIIAVFYSGYTQVIVSHSYRGKVRLQ